MHKLHLPALAFAARVLHGRKVLQRKPIRLSALPALPSWVRTFRLC